MEHLEREVAILEETIADAKQAQLVALSDLQLAFVGGGVGEISPF